jgi:hypothetical protein
MKTKILELREQGFSYNQIVAELGCAKSTVSYYCGQEQKTKQLVRNKDKRNKLVKHIQESKSNKVCMDCGHSYPHFVMDYDHRPGVDKKSNVSNVSNFSSLVDLMEEIEKCDLVCANCHRMRTWERLVSSGNSLLIDGG